MSEVGTDRGGSGGRREAPGGGQRQDRSNRCDAGGSGPLRTPSEERQRGRSVVAVHRDPAGVITNGWAGRGGAAPEPAGRDQERQGRSLQQGRRLAAARRGAVRRLSQRAAIKSVRAGPRSRAEVGSGITGPPPPPGPGPPPDGVPPPVPPSPGSGPGVPPPPGGVNPWRTWSPGGGTTGGGITGVAGVT